MDLLLDTYTLIWFLNGDEKLPDNVRDAIENPTNSKIVSIDRKGIISVIHRLQEKRG